MIWSEISKFLFNLLMEENPDEQRTTTVKS